MRVLGGTIGTTKGKKKNRRKRRLEEFSGCRQPSLSSGAPNINPLVSLILHQAHTIQDLKEAAQPSPCPIRTGAVRECHQRKSGVEEECAMKAPCDQSHPVDKKFNSRALIPHLEIEPVRSGVSVKPSPLFFGSVISIHACLSEHRCLMVSYLLRVIGISR